jgi:hypothetical protein
VRQFNVIDAFKHEALGIEVVQYYATEWMCTCNHDRPH